MIHLDLPRDVVEVPTRVELLHPMVVQSLRSMSPADRIRHASNMHRSTRAMLAGVVKSLHPDWGDEQVANEVRRRLLRGTT